MIPPSSKLRIYSGFSTTVSATRECNEDALVHRKIPLGYFAAVADGMGCYVRGETAAAIALASFIGVLGAARSDPAGALRKGFDKANSNLRIHSRETGNVMGASCVAAIVSCNRLYVGHVGDARLYLLRGANLYCLTRDHSLMQEIVDIKGPDAANEFSPSLKHVMSRSAGAEDEIVPTVREPVTLATGDTIMLCTDGFSTVTDARMIRRVLAGSTPREAAIRLVELSKESGGTDCTTVLVLRVDIDAANETLPLISTEELTMMLVRTADAQRYPIIDVVVNPTTWTISGLVLDLSKVEKGATCEIPIRDVGPMSGYRNFLTTPQRTEALLAMYRLNSPDSRL